MPRNGVSLARYSFSFVIFCTAIRFCRSGGISNRSAAFSMASFSVRLQQCKMFGALADYIDAPAGILTTSPIRNGQRSPPGGCSFQLARTSILFPRLPHLAPRRGIRWRSH
jgi:hypothetical protein